MNCFFIFKGKSKREKKNERGVNSAPEFGNQTSSSDNSSFNFQPPRSLSSSRGIQDLYIETENNLTVFSYQQLREATKSFDRTLKIGEGGFGNVYKGTVRVSSGPRVAVAIKKLNKNGLQGHKEWLAEVQFLGVVNHPNVVKLLGYCCDEDERGVQRLLVYEFMPNKSLEDHLFRRNLPVLPWIRRLEIMHGAAQGLAYLHGGLEIEVIHRDFKSSNVLLDENFTPKLSDFGLAREGPQGGRTHVSTAKVGTYGYAAPEYIETGHLRTQSDVWSFGIVLYEILTGRHVIERNRPTSEQKLLDWVKQFPAESKRFGMIIDPRLRNNYSIDSARKVAKLADRCLNRNDKERPKMGFVAESLKMIIDEADEGNASTMMKSLIGGSKGTLSNEVSVRG